MSCRLPLTHVNCAVKTRNTPCAALFGPGLIQVPSAPGFAAAFPWAEYAFVCVFLGVMSVELVSAYLPHAVVPV